MTSAEEIASAGVIRSSNAISGESQEESPPKVRRKLPVPMPKWASQLSPCNDVSPKGRGSRRQGKAPPAATPWDKLRGDQFDVIENEVALNEVISTAAAQRMVQTVEPSPGPARGLHQEWQTLSSLCAPTSSQMAFRAWSIFLQLIPEGLSNLWQHLARAKTLAHPAMDDTGIHSGTQDNYGMLRRPRLGRSLKESKQ